MNQQARSRTSGIDRSLQVMDILAERRAPMSAYDLAKSAGAPVSTIYRIVDELVEREMLSRGTDNTVWLGPRLMRYGLVYRARLDVFGLARAEMQRLVAGTGETVQICARDGGMMLVIGMEEGEGHFRVASTVGTRVPLNWTASGRLLLGHLGDEARRAAFAASARPSHTGMAETDPDRLAAQAKVDFERPAGGAVQRLGILGRLHRRADPRREGRLRGDDLDRAARPQGRGAAAGTGGRGAGGGGFGGALAGPLGRAGALRRWREPPAGISARQGGRRAPRRVPAPVRGRGRGPRRSCGDRFEDRLDLDGDLVRQAGDAEGRAGMHAGLAEHVGQQIRGAVDDIGMAVEIRGGIDQPQQLHHPADAVEAAEMAAQRRKDVAGDQFGMAAGVSAETSPPTLPRHRLPSAATGPWPET